jgi:hypothetical protein
MSQTDNTKLPISGENQTPISTSGSAISIPALPQKEPTTFNFLSLPVEIRTRIYRLCLATTSPVTLSLPLLPPNTWCSHPPASKPRLSANLLRSNRQIYQEANQYAYLHRTFRIAKSCKLCFENLTLNDSVALRQLQPSTIHKIRALELRLNIDCTSKLALRKKLLRTQTQLQVVGGMQSLESLTIKIVFFRHDFSLLNYLIFTVQDPAFEKLFTKVYRTVTGSVEVDWEVEINEEGGLSDKAELEKKATEELRRRAEKYGWLQGVGGNKRARKGRQRNVLKTASASSC